MMNIKKLAAGTAIALLLGVSAIAGPMTAVMANADGPSKGFVQNDTPDYDPAWRVAYTVVVTNKDTEQVFDTFGSFRTLAP